MAQRRIRIRAVLSAAYSLPRGRRTSPPQDFVDHRGLEPPADGLATRCVPVTPMARAHRYLWLSSDDVRITAAARSSLLLKLSVVRQLLEFKGRRRNTTDAASGPYCSIRITRNCLTMR